jgi:hypothetical protein
MSPCEFELYWIALAGFVGLSLGSCAGVIFAGLLHASTRMWSDAPHPPEPVGAYDLDDPIERQQFEAQLLRRNGGRP